MDAEILPCSMDIDVIERNIANLEKSLDSLEIWLAVMTTLVVIGLVLEYWHEVPDAIRQLRNRWSWEPLLVVLGGVLITIGVAGELVVQFIASGKETELRRANDDSFSILNNEAGKARQVAADANLKAAKADERAADAEKEAQQLRTKAEDERLARVLIEQSLAGRSLSSSDEQRLSNRLGHFRDVQFAVWYHAGAAEEEAFAWDIAKALHSAKLKVFSPASLMDLAGNGLQFDPALASLVSGVMVASTNGGQGRIAAELLVQALNDSGFDATLNPKPNPGSLPTVWVNIETRPKGPQGEAKLNLTARNRTWLRARSGVRKVN